MPTSSTPSNSNGSCSWCSPASRARISPSSGSKIGCQTQMRAGRIEARSAAERMADNLVIVESPAKARTIKKYLGKDFEVLASYGHVRDLVPKEGAVDTEHGFAMRYQTLENNARHVEPISRALKKAKALYLATGPDREGEAIAWHLLEMLKERGEIGDRAVHR